MKCPNCAAEVTGRFCEYCGSEMKQDAPQVINITNNYYSDNPNERIDRAFNDVTPVPVIQKSKNTAGILSIVLGALGIGNFYLGYTKRGIVQVLMTMFGLGAITVLWGLIQGFIILSSPIAHDANGNLLK
jgi:TM2 domain-containing membrane protein YozV